MTDRRGEKKKSLKGVYYTVFWFALLVILLSFFLSMYMERMIRRQVLETNHANFEKEIAELEQICQSGEYSILNLLNTDENVRILKEETDEVLRISAKRTLNNTLGELRSNSLNVCNFFYYNGKEKSLIMPVGTTLDPVIAQQINQCVTQYIEQEENYVVNRGWMLLQTEGNSWFIVKIYQEEEHCVGVFITLDKIYERFGVNRFSQAKHYMTFINNESIITEKDQYERITGETKPVVNRNRRTRIYRDYEVSFYEFNKGEFSLVFMINIMENYQRIQQLMTFLICFIFFILGIGIWLLYYIRKNLLRPVNEFINRLSVEEITKEEMQESPTAQPYFAEMALVDSMFKKARQEIRDLKISFYEQELEKNRIEMEYLQQQIKPHFYLNCMNIIYSMAQTNHLEEIKKLSVSVSDYLRAIFKKSDVPVTLADEMRHVQNYLNINAIRYEDEFEAEISIPEELEKCEIIPLVIHTLVENSLKHALYASGVLKIKIEVAKVQEDRMVIQVRDNGFGFSEQTLQALNRKEGLNTEDGRHIGLSNTIRRLETYYQGEATIRFANPKGGGALIEIMLPLRKRE